MRERKKKRKALKAHAVEIIVVLLIFAMMAVANALAGSNLSKTVSEKIEVAKAGFPTDVAVASAEENLSYAEAGTEK